MGIDLTNHWHAAQSIEDYVGQLWRKNRVAFTRNRDRTRIDDITRERFATRSRRILILTEPYCEDSAQFVPAIWQLGNTVTGIDVRILRQHEHPDLSTRYLADDHPAIPVFILLDESLHELGALVERPIRVTTDLTAQLRCFQQAHPDLPGIGRTLERMPEETRTIIKQHIAAWRDDGEQHQHWAGYLFEDLAALAGDSAG